jgi:hypothetical protein
MLYRGQPYGAPVGEWWTTSLDEAKKFAMSRGGNRTYVVLALDEDETEWLSGFLFFKRTGRGSDNGDWYRIPLTQIRERWRGVKIHSGAISIEAAP